MIVFCILVFPSECPDKIYIQWQTFQNWEQRVSHKKPTSLDTFCVCTNIQIHSFVEGSLLGIPLVLQYRCIFKGILLVRWEGQVWFGLVWKAPNP